MKRVNRYLLFVIRVVNKSIGHRPEGIAHGISYSAGQVRVFSSAESVSRKSF